MSLLLKTRLGYCPRIWASLAPLVRTRAGISVLSPRCLTSMPVNLSPIKLVDQHLISVLKEMHEKDKMRQWADWKDKNYKGAVAEFHWLPGYMIKFDNGRINGGELLRKTAQEMRLHLITIPEQTPYKIPEIYHSITHLRSLCISKKIEGLQGLDKKITAKQAEQLTALVKATGIADLKWRNLVHCADGKIALIDTESFWGERLGLASLREQNSFEHPI